jgi:hypothetical protein
MTAACYECGRPAHMSHHVVPRVFGGTRTIPLCEDCHAKAEGLPVGTFSRYAAKVRAGIARAKTQGVRWGRPRTLPTLIEMPGGTVRSAAAAWGVPKSTAHRWITKGRPSSQEVTEG